MTTTPAITADSREGRLLLALRRGPHEPGELAEQFGNLSGLQGQLMRAGLIAYDGDVYTLTEAGRAACPFRNPLAAKPATPPEVFIMPKGETHVTRQQVLDVIIAGGPSGATRNALIEKFAGRATESAIEMHMSKLHREVPAVVFKPKAGVLVGIQFKPADAAPEIAPETPSTATVQEKLDNTITVLSVVTGLKDAAEARVKELESRPVSYPVETLDVEQITARPVVFDTDLEDPDSITFAIFSSGGLDIYTDQGTISLNGKVLNKLRAFLGLFVAEAA